MKLFAPTVPNFEGLRQAEIKSFKFHLKHVVGDNILTFEQFLTVTNQVEGILNSRPLTSLTSDIDDSEVQGLNFRARWRDSGPKFRNPVEKNSEGREIPTLENSWFS